MRTLGIVPCHLASRRLHRKNLLTCGGRTLLEWTAAQCQQSRRLSAWVVSTPDQEVVDACTLNGWPVSTLAAKLHGKASLGHICQTELQGHPERFEAVMCLQPTSPLRLPGDIDRAISTLETTPNCQAVVGRRSDKHASTCGTVFLVRAELLPSLPLEGPGVVPIYIPPERAVDVDTAYDLWLADKLLTLPDSPVRLS
jgi:CMP-N-acetylneuraminic acid synthetase